MDRCLVIFILLPQMMEKLHYVYIKLLKQLNFLEEILVILVIHIIGFGQHNLFFHMTLNYKLHIKADIQQINHL